MSSCESRQAQCPSPSLLEYSPEKYDFLANPQTNSFHGRQWERESDSGQGPVQVVKLPTSRPMEMMVVTL